MIAQVLMAALGTLAYSVIFAVPKKLWGWCALIGAGGWLVYLLLTAREVSTTAATLAATVGVILLARIFAVLEKCPATVFIIPGIIPLVPGAQIYWTAYYLVTSQTGMAMHTGFTALKSAVAIVVGIVAVFELPYSLFRGRHGRKGERHV